MKSTRDDMTREEVLEMHKNTNYLQINEKEFENLANEVAKIRAMNTKYTLYPTHVTTTTTSPNNTVWQTTTWDNMITAYLAYVFGVATASDEGLTISQDVYSWNKVKKYGLKVIFLVWLFKNGRKNKDPFGPVSSDSPFPSITWTISGREITYNNIVV